MCRRRLQVGFPWTVPFIVLTNPCRAAPTPNREERRSIRSCYRCLFFFFPAMAPRGVDNRHSGGPLEFGLCRRRRPSLFISNAADRDSIALAGGRFGDPSPPHPTLPPCIVLTECPETRLKKKNKEKIGSTPVNERESWRNLK